MMDPSHIMASISRSTFMSNYCDQLIISGVKALTVRSIQYFIMLFFHFLFFLFLRCLSHQLFSISFFLC